jgi:hypothetical protein
MVDGMVVDISCAFTEEAADTAPGRTRATRRRPMSRLMVLDLAKIFMVSWVVQHAL